MEKKDGDTKTAPYCSLVSSKPKTKILCHRFKYKEKAVQDSSKRQYNEKVAETVGDLLWIW